MAHVLALGGAGNMGRPAVRTLLAERPDVDRLTVADADGDRAGAFVARLDDDRAEAIELDITDRTALAAALDDVTLAMNTVGPFYEFGTTVLDACLEAGIDYVDICDDWEPTEAMLSLDDRARAAGVSAAVGFGASPGVSNLFAVYAADELDRTEELLTAWFTGPGGGGADAAAAAVHGLHMVAEAVPTYRKGERVFVEPFADGRSVRFPAIGAYDLYHVGHPEPVTLPGHVEAETVANLGGFYPAAVNDAYRDLAERLQADELTVEDALADLPSLVSETLSGAGHDPDDPPRAGGVAAVAVGERRGRRIECTCTLGSNPGSGMGGATGIPLAIAAGVLLDGAVEDGVHPPEGAMEPGPFFKRLAPHCAEPYRTVQVDYRAVD